MQYPHCQPGVRSRWGYLGPSHELHLAAWRCYPVYITPACQDKQPGPPFVTASMCLPSCDQVWATSGILAVGHGKLGAFVEGLTEG